MADTKITALTELAATPTTADILAIIDDPGGTPLSKKITVDNFMNFAAADVITFTNKTYALGGTGNAFTGTAAEFDTAVTDDNFAFLGAANTFTGANIIDNATGLTFNNQGAGTDPIIFANDGSQILDITGGLDVSGVIDCAGTVQEGGVDISPIGIHDIWIPAGAMNTTTTNGAESTTREIAEDQPTLQVMAFDTATQEHAQFSWTPPRNWDRGTITYECYWTAASGASGTFTVDVGARAYGEGDPLGTNITGGEVSVTDTLTVVDDLHISDTSAALTVQGTLADGKEIIFQLSRPTSDTIGQDVEVLGLYIHFTTDAATAA